MNLLSRWFVQRGILCRSIEIGPSGRLLHMRSSERDDRDVIATFQARLLDDRECQQGKGAGKGVELQYRGNCRQSAEQG